METKVRNVKNRILALALALVMLLSAAAAYMPLRSHAAGEIDGHQLIASNSGYNLYMREGDLSLVVEDKASGALMESAMSYDDGLNNNTWLGMMRSALVLTIINGNDDTKQADLLNDDVKKTISYTADGFTAECFWTKYQFGVTLEVSLTDEGLLCRIADDSIVEKSEQYQIGTISMYPFMGGSYLDSKEGYLFIPDGNGALIYLDDKEGRFSVGYSATVYGGDIGFKESEVVSLLWDKYDMITDGEQIMAPVYGIAHTDDQMAYLAVIEDGAMRATIEAHPNGASVDYNRAYARFVQRRLYTQPTSNNSTQGSLHLAEADRSHSDLAVRFLFLSGDEANYAGMAGAYRDYLIGRGDLAVSGDEYRTRLDYLGTERETWVMGTRAVVMTRVEDIEEITADLKAAGVDSLFSVYKGWQAGGLYDVPITKYKADGKIGGTSKLTSLIKDMEAAGNEFYLYSDALRINPDEQNATFNVVKQINKRRYYADTYKDVYEQMMYLTPARSGKLTNQFVKSYTQKGVNGLCIGGITNNLFSYTYGGVTYSRHDCGNSYLSTIDGVASQTDLVLEQPFAYLWHDTKAFLDMPMYTSSYIFEDESVPFLSIVLKGVMPVYADYVNFEANKQEFFLKMVETASLPSFYLTKESSADLIYTNSSDIYSSEYSSYKDTIVAYDQELSAFHAKVEGAHISSHDILDNGLTVVAYDNGVKVYINYTESEQTADGVSVEAMDYAVVD